MEIFLLMKFGARIMMTNHGADHSSMPEMYSGGGFKHSETAESHPQTGSIFLGQQDTRTKPKTYIHEGHSEEASNPVI